MNIRKIGEAPSKKNLGYFVVKGILNSLSGVEEAVWALDIEYDYLTALIYSRAISDDDIYDSPEETLDLLFEDYSKYNVSSFLYSLGLKSKEIAEIFDKALKDTFNYDASYDLYWDWYPKAEDKAYGLLEYLHSSLFKKSSE